MKSIYVGFFSSCSLCSSSVHSPIIISPKIMNFKQSFQIINLMKLNTSTIYRDHSRSFASVLHVLRHKLALDLINTELSILRYFFGIYEA